MRIRVLYFAAARELAGVDAQELELPAGATLATLRAELERQHAALAPLPFVFAVNQRYADGEAPLHEGDEVALVPAISGGAGPGDDEPPRFAFAFTHAPIDARPLEAACRRDADGALVTFWGVTRDHHAGRAVQELSYEAYEPMAIRTMLGILEELGTREDLGRIHAVHRLGDVPIGEASICVVVSAPHRAPAFEVAQAVMDRLKREVPIFKKERLKGGDDERWVGELPTP